jgi:hypothetical protein
MTGFDDHERQRWAGRASAYERSFAPLCAHPAGPLLDAAGVAAGDRVLDVGTGTGMVAALAAARGGQVVAVAAEPPPAGRHSPAGQPPGPAWCPNINHSTGSRASGRFSTGSLRPIATLPGCSGCPPRRCWRPL